MIDIGAGDGAYAFRRALCEANTFALAIDASADGLLRSAWKAHRARLRNVVFLVESVERLPDALDGMAHEVTVHFPWGSLLKGVLSADPAVIAPLGALLAPDGELRMLVSATARDGYAAIGCDHVRRSADAYQAYGLSLVDVRSATSADLRESGSSWAKRLGPDRAVVFARYRRRLVR